LSSGLFTFYRIFFGEKFLPPSLFYPKIQAPKRKKSSKPAFFNGFSAQIPFHPNEKAIGVFIAVIISQTGLFCQNSCIRCDVIKKCRKINKKPQAIQ
jgi:hypothetical protein